MRQEPGLEGQNKQFLPTGQALSRYLLRESNERREGPDFATTLTSTSAATQQPFMAEVKASETKGMMKMGFFSSDPNE